MPVAIAEAAAAAQRLRRETEKGIRFRRSASRVLQARRIVKGMNIGKDFYNKWNFLFRQPLEDYKDLNIAVINEVYYFSKKNISILDADPMLLAQQLSARPSIVSMASEEGFYSMQTQPLPSDFSFVPAFKVIKSTFISKM